MAAQERHHEHAGDQKDDSGHEIDDMIEVAAATAAPTTISPTMIERIANARFDRRRPSRRCPEGSSAGSGVHQPGRRCLARIRVVLVG
jgi:hypothetical protein